MVFPQEEFQAMYDDTDSPYSSGQKLFARYACDQRSLSSEGCVRARARYSRALPINVLVLRQGQGLVDRDRALQAACCVIQSIDRRIARPTGVRTMAVTGGGPLCEQSRPICDIHFIGSIA